MSKHTSNQQFKVAHTKMQMTEDTPFFLFQVVVLVV